MPTLPTEINVQIFAKLDCRSLVNVNDTCVEFRQTVQEHNLLEAAALGICPWLTEPIGSSWESTARHLSSKSTSGYTEISSYDTNEILSALPSVQFPADLDMAFEQEEPVDPDGEVMFETQRAQLDSLMFRVSREGCGKIYMSPSMSSDVSLPEVISVDCGSLTAKPVTKGYLIGDPEPVPGGFESYTGQLFNVPEGDFSHQTVADGKFYGLLRRHGELLLYREGSKHRLVHLPFGSRKSVDIRLHIVYGHAFFTATSLISSRPQSTMLYVVGRDSGLIHPLFDCHPYDIPHNFAVRGEYLYLCKGMKLFQFYFNAEDEKVYLCRIINNPVGNSAAKTYSCGQFLLVKSFAGSQVLFDLDNDVMSQIIHDRDVNCIVRYEDELVCFCYSKSFLTSIASSGGRATATS